MKNEKKKKKTRQREELRTKEKRRTQKLTMWGLKDTDRTDRAEDERSPIAGETIPPKIAQQVLQVEYKRVSSPLSMWFES